MPSPNKKKRRLVDEEVTTPPPSTAAAWRRRPTNENSDWQKLLSGATTPDATSTFISVTHSPFATTPSLETKEETKQETPSIDKDGFAIPTPALSTVQSAMKTPVPTPSSTVPPNPLSSLLSAKLTPQSSRKLTPFTPSSDDIKDVPSIELNYRKLMITAYQVYEEETMLKLEDKNVKTHINSMLDGMKQKTGARGDKLVIQLKELLDYIPKTYKGWQRSAMQKNFHRNFMQAVCLHLYRDDPDIDMGSKYTFNPSHRKNILTNF